MTRLGRGLHSLQDIYAHGNIEPIAHKYASNEPYMDDPSWTSSRISRTKRATIAYVKHFRRLVDGY